MKRWEDNFLALGYPPYPACLAAIEDAPPLLSMRGHSLLLQKPGVAIVGSRNASLNARKLAERIGKELTEAGFVVISGLARGIDSAAHRGSLQKLVVLLRSLRRALMLSIPQKM